MGIFNPYALSNALYSCYYFVILSNEGTVLGFFLLFSQEIDSLRPLMAECSDDKDMLDMATEDLGQAFEEEKRL